MEYSDYVSVNLLEVRLSSGTLIQDGFVRDFAFAEGEIRISYVAIWGNDFD